MKRNLFSITLLLILALVLCMTFVACDPTDPTTPPTGGGSGDGIGDGGDDIPGWQVPEGEYTIAKEPGHNQLTFYWSHPGVIENCDIWMWWDGKEGSGYEMHLCDYGAKVVVNVPENITEVGFIVRTGCSDPGGSSWGEAIKDGTSEDRFATIEGEETFIWLKSGDANQYTSTDGGQTLTQIKKFTLAGMIESLCAGIGGVLIFGLGLCLAMQVIGSGVFNIVLGILLGIVGMIGMIIAYPVYRKMVQKAKAEYAPRILQLTDELMMKN